MKVLLAIIVIFAVLVNVVFFFLLWSGTPQSEKEAATAVFKTNTFIEGDTGRGFFVAKGRKLFGWVKDGHFFFEQIYEGGEGVIYKVKIDETIEILK
jgi:hypothetical protein